MVEQGNGDNRDDVTTAGGGAGIGTTEGSEGAGATAGGGGGGGESGSSSSEGMQDPRASWVPPSGPVATSSLSSSSVVLPEQ